MKKILLICGLAALFPFFAQAKIQTVTVSDFQFTPSTFSINVGDTVVWVWMSGSHTTTSTTIPAGAVSWDSPISSSNTSFAYKATVAGNYGFKCTPHAAMGMTGSFTVNTPSSVATVANGATAIISANPVSSVLQVSLAGRCDVKLVNIIGKSVFQQMNVYGNLSIPVADLPAGIYFLDCAANGSHELRRVQVLH